MFYIKYIIIVLHQNRFDPCLAMSMAMPLRDQYQYILLTWALT